MHFKWNCDHDHLVLVNWCFLGCATSTRSIYAIFCSCNLQAATIAFSPPNQRRTRIRRGSKEPSVLKHLRWTHFSSTRPTRELPCHHGHHGPLTPQSHSHVPPVVHGSSVHATTRHLLDCHLALVARALVHMAVEQADETRRLQALADAALAELTPLVVACSGGQGRGEERGRGERERRRGQVGIHTWTFEKATRVHYSLSIRNCEYDQRSDRNTSI